MILRFLRLLPAFRSREERIVGLEVQLRESAERVIEADDTIRSLTAEREQARSETIQILKEYSDFWAYQTTRRTVHGTQVQAEQPAAEFEPTPARGIHGRRHQANKYAEFMRDAERFFESELGQRQN